MRAKADESGSRRAEITTAPRWARVRCLTTIGVTIYHRNQLLLNVIWSQT
jgi:hypothetical protein